MATKNSQTYYQQWYEANKEKLSERRRQLYAAVPSRRLKATTYQRKYRERITRPSTKGKPHFRKINGVLLQVVRVGTAAHIAGCSKEFIRKYEAAGIIPTTVVNSAHRYYTVKQVNLIKDFFDIMVQLKYSKNKDLKAAALRSQSAVMQSNWIGE